MLSRKNTPVSSAPGSQFQSQSLVSPRSSGSSRTPSHDSCVVEDPSCETDVDIHLDLHFSSTNGSKNIDAHTQARTITIGSFARVLSPTDIWKRRSTSKRCPVGTDLEQVRSSSSSFAPSYAPSSSTEAPGSTSTLRRSLWKSPSLVFTRARVSSRSSTIHSNLGPSDDMGAEPSRLEGWKIRARRDRRGKENLDDGSQRDSYIRPTSFYDSLKTTVRSLSSTGRAHELSRVQSPTTNSSSTMVYEDFHGQAGPTMRPISQSSNQTSSTITLKPLHDRPANTSLAKLQGIFQTPQIVDIAVPEGHPVASIGSEGKSSSVKPQHPLVTRPLSKAMTATTRQTSLGHLFPSTRIPPIDYVAPAPRLQVPQLDCFHQHKDMRRSGNRHCPVACATCGKSEQDTRWRCTWCSVRICQGCMDVLAKTRGRDLRQAVKVVTV